MDRAELAQKMMAARESVKGFLREDYTERLSPIRGAIERIEARAGCQLLAAVAELMKLQEDPTSRLFVLAAGLDLLEERELASLVDADGSVPPGRWTLKYDGLRKGQRPFTVLDDRGRRVGDYQLLGPACRALEGHLFDVLAIDARGNASRADALTFSVAADGGRLAETLADAGAIGVSGV